MPKLGLTMVEGKVLKWLKKEGDTVKKGEPLFEVESDKSSFTVEAPADGILRVILAGEGETVPCTQTVAVIAEVDEDISSLLGEEQTRPAEGEKESPLNVSHNVSASSPVSHSDKKVKISPRAKKLAKEHNIDYTQITGTGPKGRIIEKDVKAFIERQAKNKITPLAAKIAQEKDIDLTTVKGSGVSGRIFSTDLPVVGTGTSIESRVSATNQKDITVVPYTGMRKVIGDRLSQSKLTAPHVYFTVSVDMTRAKEVRTSIYKMSEEKISYTDIIVYATARALLKYPALNASLNNDEIIYHNYVNIGIAVAIENGLIVPVIRDAHRKSLIEISHEAKKLVQKARDHKLMPDEYKGSTFTVSNLGMTGIEDFTAIINPPEVAILAVSAIKKTPVVNEETDEIEIKPMMNITLSADHRVIDGMVAAEFLKKLKTYLEEPYCLL